VLIAAASVPASKADPRDVSALLRLVDVVSNQSVAAAQNTADKEPSSRDPQNVLPVSYAANQERYSASTHGTLHLRMVHSRHKLARDKVEP
jgi:hypothetical protein